MLLTVYDITPEKLTSALITLIEAETDLTQPRHIQLTQLIHGMSGWGVRTTLGRTMSHRQS